MSGVPKRERIAGAKQVSPEISPVSSVISLRESLTSVGRMTASGAKPAASAEIDEREGLPLYRPSRQPAGPVELGWIAAISSSL